MFKKQKTISKLLNFGIKKLARSKVNNSKFCAQVLLAEVAGLSRQQLYSHFDDKLEKSQIKKYKEFIDRRANHEPVQYILGYANFRDLEIKVGPGVLIPRPETEMLVQYVIDRSDNKVMNILDLCTGSACIACSLAKEFHDSKIVATDISNNALSYALENVEKYELASQIDLYNTNLADGIDEISFDVIVSNPPYVPGNVYDNLDMEVKKFEPKISLWAGFDGLYFFEDILDIAKDKLNDDGFAIIELYEEVLDKAAEIANNYDFSSVEILKDLTGTNRFLYFKA